MSKRRTAIIALALAAATTVGGGTYALSGLTGQTQAAPAAQATVNRAVEMVATTGTSPASDAHRPQELRTQILEMLKDHMGITGSEADKLATTMVGQMQKNGNTNMADMVKQCAATTGQMMGGREMMGAGGMMNGVTSPSSGTTGTTGAHESHHPSTS